MNSVSNNKFAEKARRHTQRLKTSSSSSSSLLNHGNQNENNNNSNNLEDVNDFELSDDDNDDIIINDNNNNINDQQQKKDSKYLNVGDQIVLNDPRGLDVQQLFIGINWLNMKSVMGNTSSSTAACCAVIDHRGCIVDAVNLHQSESRDGTIIMLVDEESGKTEEDDAQFRLDLATMPINISHIVFFIAATYSSKTQNNNNNNNINNNNNENNENENNQEKEKEKESTIIQSSAQEFSQVSSINFRVLNDVVNEDYESPEDAADVLCQHSSGKLSSSSSSSPSTNGMVVAALSRTSSLQRDNKVLRGCRWKFKVLSEEMNIDFRHDHQQNGRHYLGETGMLQTMAYIEKALGILPHDSINSENNNNNSENNNNNSKKLIPKNQCLVDGSNFKLALDSPLLLQKGDDILLSNLTEGLLRIGWEKEMAKVYLESSLIMFDDKGGYIDTIHTAHRSNENQSIVHQGQEDSENDHASSSSSKSKRSSSFNFLNYYYSNNNNNKNNKNNNNNKNNIYMTENMFIDLDRIPSYVHSFFVTICVFSVDTAFKDIRNVFLQLFNKDTITQAIKNSSSNNNNSQIDHEIPPVLSFVLSEISGSNKKRTSLFLSKFYRVGFGGDLGGMWRMGMLSNFGDGRSAVELKQYLESYCFCPHLVSMSVTVLEARNLNAHDSNGMSDPYVVVDMTKAANAKFKTKTVHKSLNPKWDDETFQVDGVLLHDDMEVRIMVWDKDRLSDDDFMGTCSIFAIQLLEDINVFGCRRALSDDLGSDVSSTAGSPRTYNYRTSVSPSSSEWETSHTLSQLEQVTPNAKSSRSVRDSLQFNHEYIVEKWYKLSTPTGNFIGDSVRDAGEIRLQFRIQVI